MSIIPIMSSSLPPSFPSFLPSLSLSYPPSILSSLSPSLMDFSNFSGWTLAIIVADYFDAHIVPDLCNESYFKLASVSFKHFPFFLLKHFSLSAIKRCLMFMLYFPCSIPEMIHFFLQEPGPFRGKWCLKTKFRALGILIAPWVWLLFVLQADWTKKYIILCS